LKCSGRSSTRPEPVADERHRQRQENRRYRGDDRLNSVRFYSTPIGDGRDEKAVSGPAEEQHEKFNQNDFDDDRGDFSSKDATSWFSQSSSAFRDADRWPSVDPPPPRLDYRDLSGLATVVWNVLALVDALVIWRRVTWTYVAARRIWRRLSSDDLALSMTATCSSCRLHNGNGLPPSEVADHPTRYSQYCYHQCRHSPHTQSAERLPVSNGRPNAGAREPSSDVVDPHPATNCGDESSSSSLPRRRCRRRRRCGGKIASTGSGILVHCVRVLLSDTMFPVSALTVGTVSLSFAVVGIVALAFAGLMRPLVETDTSRVSPEFSPGISVGIGDRNDFFSSYDDDDPDRRFGGKQGGSVGLQQTSVVQLASLHTVIDAFNAGKRTCRSRGYCEVLYSQLDIRTRTENCNIVANRKKLLMR
jgi:hypothetical protein